MNEYILVGVSNNAQGARVDFWAWDGKNAIRMPDDREPLGLFGVVKWAYNKSEMPYTHLNSANRGYRHQDEAEHAVKRAVEATNNNIQWFICPYPLS